MTEGISSDFALPPPAGLGWARGPRPIRDLKGLSPVLAQAGSFELRLATTRKEIRRAQRLRFDVFYRSGDALPDAYKSATGRDSCAFDRVCDHLVVVDRASLEETSGKARVIGTTRLLRGDVAAGEDGFYSETEFVLGPLLERHRDKRFLEIGRSCVHPEFRARRVIELLWHGIGVYAAHHCSHVLIGCSSLKGTGLDALAPALGFAFHHARAPAAWQVAAIEWRAARMDWLDRAAVNARQAFMTLPPLMKAYVRAGGTFASQAAVDHQFGTTDLFTVLPLASANPRYLSQFGAGSSSLPLAPHPLLQAADTRADWSTASPDG